MRKRIIIGFVVLLAVSFVGFIVSIAVNPFVFDEYDAYGEMPIPGTRTLHLPEGEVKVSFHNELVGSMEGGEMPIPPDLEVAITAPSGVAEPKFVQIIGTTTASNQDAHRPVGVVHIPAAGDYTIKANGKVGAFLSPRLSFGYDNGLGFLPWLFGGLALVSGLALAFLFFTAVHQAIVRPQPMTPLQQHNQDRIGAAPAPAVAPAAVTPPPRSTAQRLQELEALRATGAISDAECTAKREQIIADI